MNSGSFNQVDNRDRATPITARHFLSTNSATNTTAPVAYAAVSGVTPAQVGSSAHYTAAAAVDPIYTDNKMFRVGDIIETFISGPAASHYSIKRARVIKVTSGEVHYVIPGFPPGGASGGAGAIILHYDFVRLLVFGKKAAKTNNTGAVVVDFSPDLETPPTLFPFSIAAGAMLTFDTVPGAKMDLGLIQYQVATANDGVVLVFQ
jgi:hypothetical protein